LSSSSGTRPSTSRSYETDVDVIWILKAEVNALKTENKGSLYSVDYNRRQVSELLKQLVLYPKKLHSTQNEEAKIWVNVTKAKDILATHKQNIVLLQEQLKTQCAMVEAAKTNITRLWCEESEIIQKIKNKVDLKEKLDANIRVLRDDIISCNIELAKLSKKHVDTEYQKETLCAISPEQQIPVVQEVEKKSEENLSKTPEQHATAQDDIMFVCIDDWFSDSGNKTPFPIPVPAPVPIHTRAPTISQPMSCAHVPVHIFDSGDEETDVQTNSKFRECRKRVLTVDSDSDESDVKFTVVDDKQSTNLSSSSKSTMAPESKRAKLVSRKCPQHLHGVMTIPYAGEDMKITFPLAKEECVALYQTFERMFADDSIAFISRVFSR
jgi:hypothetical protein